MLNGGHLDINSIQFCSDSLKERLKQTMLNQELVFMGQVLELHRLYRAQTAMAEDSKRRGLDHCNSHIRGVNSSPLNLNNQVKSFMSGIQCTTPGFKQKPLDLQLSADEFICQSEKRNAVPIDLNLSLSFGEETSKKGEHRSWMGKGACAPPPEIIDLEDPNLIVSNCDVNPGVSSGFSASISSVKEKNVFQRSAIGDKHNSQSFSNSGVRHVSNGATSSRPFINVDLTVQRQTLYKSGLNGDVLASDTSIPHNKPMMLDLNTIQLDDLSDLSNANSGVFNSLARTVFSSSGRELNVNNCAQTPDILVQNNPKPGNKISIEKNKPEDNRGKIIIIDLDSDSDSGEELCSSGSDPKIESVGSSSKLANELLCGFEIGEAAKPELGLEKDPKSPCQNILVTESLDLNTICSESNIENVGSSSKLSNGLLCGFEIGGAVGPELGVEKDPKPFCHNVLVTESQSEAVERELGLEKDTKPFCQNVLVTESLDSNTLCCKSKIESGGSLSKLSSGRLYGFEMGGAVGSELDVEKDTKSFCQNGLVTESLDSNTLSSKSKIESRGSSSKPLNGLLFGLEMGGAAGPELGVEKDPKPFGQNLMVTESLDSNTLCSKSKIESGGSSSKHSNMLVCGFEMGEAGVPKLGLDEDPKPFCQNVMVTESIDSNTLYSKSKELVVDETDQKAAELLVQLSRERPVCDVGDVTKLDSKVSRVQKKEHDRPQRSLDSYEEMVLNAKECGPEDYCVSSNAFVVDVSETDSRYKLKRGTRMKDFQKDILSSLSTLSRHEIREDINIFDGVIRSREYKRMRANYADESDWCTPRKSRRSRISRR
ncbi:uncharacterized protein LOC141591966 [Silene latifolia]|uniref:uncharacterized protein LOC141591966 n=1 Tax=Silene latifolia TaxID=37657 RepID=UPI003D77E4B5